MKKKFRITVENRKKIGGYFFTLPFTLGFLFLFLYPFLQTVMFSFNKLNLGREGYSLEFVGIANYKYALLEDTEFVETLVETVLSMLAELPVILAFSLFAAIILNQNFKGRTLARVIFFLPVIYGAGVVLKMEQTDYVTELMRHSDTLFMFSGDALRNLLTQMRVIPDWMVNYVMNAVENIPTIIRSSGIQILVFLAGLQSISPEVYEAAKVEGATAWESFWLITFPMISPLIITNTVYTIVDSLTSATNPLVDQIKNATFSGRGYGASTAMSTIYFLVIAILLGIVFKLINKYVVYTD